MKLKIISSHTEVFLETFNNLMDIVKPFSIEFFRSCHIAYSEDYSTLCLEIDTGYYDFYLDINVDQSIEISSFPKINFSSIEKNKILKFNSIEDAKEEIIKLFSLID